MAAQPDRAVVAEARSPSLNFSTPFSRASHLISIIVPVLNEAETLAQHLSALQHFRAAGHELIVVDGGSDDQSTEIAKPLCDKLLVSLKGRAIQMNHGAQQASGALLLFHHCDSILPTEALTLLESIALNQQCWGRFDVQLSENKGLLRLVGKMMSLRSRWTHIATGDQSIFVSKILLQQINGIPLQPLMEDIELSKRLKKIHPPICLSAKVITSARRWKTHGTLKTIGMMWRLRLQYFWGTAPEKLVQIYYPNSNNCT